MFPILDDEELVASAVVYTSSTEEVQKIVLWANKYSIPIFPISMGRNRKWIQHLQYSNLTTVVGYGGAAPRVRGSVVIDLGKRMNKILDINPDDYTCLLEPGVSFYALYEAIQAKGFDHMWIDVPDLGGGSVVGIPLIEGWDIPRMVIIGLVIRDWRLCFLRVRLFGLEWRHCRGTIPGRLFLTDLVLIRSK